MFRFLKVLMLLHALETSPADDTPDDQPAEEPVDEPDNEPSTDPEDYADVTDPKRKLAAMQNHINRLHRKVDKQDTYIARLEAMSESGTDEAVALRESRLEVTFLRSVIGRDDVSDIESAWDLATARGFLDAVQVSDAGDVEGMDDAIVRLVHRYPWLADEPVTSDEPDPSRPSRTANPPKRRRGTGEIGQESLKERFPALSKGR
jgi:hypothetical protein